MARELKLGVRGPGVGVFWYRARADALAPGPVEKEQVVETIARAERAHREAISRCAASTGERQPATVKLLKSAEKQIDAARACLKWGGSYPHAVADDAGSAELCNLAGLIAAHAALDQVKLALNVESAPGVQPRT